MEQKISQMEATLANTRIIKEEDLDSSKVVILSAVKIKQLKTGKAFTYTLVSQSSNLRAKDLCRVANWKRTTREKVVSYR